MTDQEFSDQGTMATEPMDSERLKVCKSNSDGPWLPKYVRRDYRDLLREIDRLRMFADWDENWIRCEGCQRWTQSRDMRTGDGEDGSCCLWCLKLDDLQTQLAATSRN